MKVIPELGQYGASETEWINFQGQWGEYTGANIGAFHIGPWGGLRDGSDNPPVQGYWKNPFSWNDLVCDGCQDETGEATDLEITASWQADIGITDTQGRYTGKNASQNGEKIPGSEYKEYPELGRKSIIIRNADVANGYRLDAVGNSTGFCDLSLTAPDRHNGSVDTIRYKGISVNSVTGMNLRLDATKNYILNVDSDGSGEMSSKLPDEMSTVNVDFIPPARVDDLKVSGSVDGGSATISFTAPGDDDYDGNASAYDIRYSTAPINDQNWKEANPVSDIAQPMRGGSGQSIIIRGLQDETSYYFALRACDDSAQCSPISNVATNAAVPRLTWERRKVYWATFIDYLEARLTVDYLMRNVGTGMAICPVIVGSRCSPDYVSTSTQLPLQVNDLAPGEYVKIPLKYYVTATVNSFTTFTFASCMDEAGRELSFPGVPNEL